MNSEGQVNTLTIHDLGFDDVGTYSCFAVNNVGSADTEGKLIVEGMLISCFYRNDCS